MAEPDWRLFQATAHVWNWQINERREADYNDPEIKALADNGILVLVDENTATVLPPPALPKSGCGCG